jgi:hypothetical protein
MAPVRAGFGSHEGRRGECSAAKRRRRSGLNWTSASASVVRKRSARGGGRPIRMSSQLAGKGGRATPCASENDAPELQPGTAALQVTARAYRMCFLRCMSMSREDSVREQENPKIRREDGIANQSGPIGFSHESTTSSSTFPSSIAEQDHNTSRKLVNPLI